MQSKVPFFSSVDRDGRSFNRCVTPEDFKIRNHATPLNSRYTQHVQYNQSATESSIEVQHYEEQLAGAHKTIQVQLDLMNATAKQLLAKEQELIEAEKNWQRLLKESQADSAAKDIQIKELELQEAGSADRIAPPDTRDLCSLTPARKKQTNYSKWTADEDELLKTAVALHGVHEWSLVANHVPNRTPVQCSARWLGALNKSVVKGRWTSEEDKLLNEAVHEFVLDGKYENLAVAVPWNKIASRIPNRTGIQCQARWTEALDPTVRKGRWTVEEDEKLCVGVKRYGRCWIRVAQGIPGRTQRQCRTRWVQVKEKAGCSLDEGSDL
ncbi:hypothetical protein K493DRAFT_304453 [Basidiobolus meristosporus CBS 931.73]|uniref:Homeodomain-like protein n=1 Tax=Basidiobolus meristosporus CBS 931.73 TaxID=1314790 RepID=A0A1Y1XYW7_9FUNG|nr:hypothetical protein K493DRAFT_304453 [Basidiobolus meristosporus CBS 931.73]|eukprot:ORX90953.1 hypothetical protein K493DRAFT_304453 [Basidiobolus meristosporus CBS 931.73]